MDHKVRTAPDGDIRIDDDLRTKLALLDDGTLFISRSHLHDKHVTGFRARLRANGIDFTIEMADLDTISKFYQKNNRVSNKHTDMQMAAKEIFKKAVNFRSSDIHIRVSEKFQTRILYRIHNDLQFIEEHTEEYGQQLCTTIYQAMSDVSSTTFEVNARQDARISDKAKLPDMLDGIRIATTPQVGGFIMVLRLLYDDTNDDNNLKPKGFTDVHINAIEYMKKRPTGVIIIAGPTGSGKSTTLKCVLSNLIKETAGKKHIITVEDPPEYTITGAVQTPVTNADTEEDRLREYKKAIKAAMRLDPDIIMISEVRDLATAKLSIEAAMTGHQVWCTVHANNAISIIHRLVDLGVDQSLITDPTIIAGLMCQRLVQVLCPHCKKPLRDHLDNFNANDIRRFSSTLKLEKVYIRGEGCDYCKNKAIVGRTVFSEVIVTDKTLMKYIKQGDFMGAEHYLYKESRLKTMLDHAIDKINDGIVDPFDAEDVVGQLDAAIIESDDRITIEELQNR